MPLQYSSKIENLLTYHKANFVDLLTSLSMKESENFEKLKKMTVIEFLEYMDDYRSFIDPSHACDAICEELGIDEPSDIMLVMRYLNLFFDILTIQ